MTNEISKPAEMDSVVLQTMKMVRICTKSLAKLTRERAESGTAMMLIMVHVTGIRNTSNVALFFGCLYSPRDATSIAARRSGTIIINKRQG